MKDPCNREMMVDFYRLYERFETPTALPEYWEALGDACNDVCAKYDSPVLTHMVHGLFDGLEAQWRERDGQAKRD